MSDNGVFYSSLFEEDIIHSPVSPLFEDKEDFNNMDVQKDIDFSKLIANHIEEMKEGKPEEDEEEMKENRKCEGDEESEEEEEDDEQSEQKGDEESEEGEEDDEQSEQKDNSDDDNDDDDSNTGYDDYDDTNDEHFHSSKKRKLMRTMALQGVYANRDVTELTNLVATSPRLKAVIVKNLPKWKPSLPLLVRYLACLKNF
jgi:hypothetical protein